jgi:hypothetical protein
MKKFLFNYLRVISLAIVLAFILAIVLAIIDEKSFYEFLDSRGYLTEFVCFYSTFNKESTKKIIKKTTTVVEGLSIENDKLLRDGYSIETAAKTTREGLEELVEEKSVEKPLKIVINDLVFNKLNDELWIDSSENDLDTKQVYDSIQGFLLEILKINSKGFINNTDLRLFPVISQFINYFTDKEEYIKGNKVPESYKWILNVLMTSLYEYSLKIMYKMESGSEMESDLMVNFEELTKNIFSRIDPSIRIKLQKRGISVIQNIYTGFDTEYKCIKPGYNDLISVQLAVNTKNLLKIPKYSEYELSTLDTLTGEVYKLNKDSEDFNFRMVENSLNKSIKEIRYLKYKENDASIFILIKGLKFLNYPFIEKEDVFVFSFPRSPIQPFIYYNEGKGYSFKDMLNQSNLIGESYLKEDYEKITDLLKKISKEIHIGFEWKEKGVEILKVIESKELPGELTFKKMTRSSLRGLGSDDKLSVTKIRNNYFIAHLTNADLSIMNDFDTLKEELNIVNKCFVTLGKPIVVGNTNVFIRDTMLLAPQGCRSLEKIGSLYGEDFKKVDIAKDLKEEQKEKLTKDLTKDQLEKINLNQYIKENMDMLLKIDKELFDSYAIKDAIIPLIHASYMEDFNFKYQGLGIPLTLSSLGAAYVKYKWKLIGYKGYQISNKYLLGDSSATQTPKGLLTTSQTGLKIAYYIANYKGGRNECYMYGVDEVTKWTDYDLTSAYTTAMSALGNPDYNKGRMITVKQLEKMSFNEILYSYIIMKVKFKFNAKTKFPSIPVHIDETTSVYPLEGEGILTGAEYLLAKSQKCELKISDIYYLPFERTKERKIINQPFKEIIKELQFKRRQYPPKTINNLLYKEMANSQYGNTARGISNKKKFDIKTGKTLRMESSELCNPIIASWTTAFIRSIVGECLDKVSKLKGKVVSATTDGFITDIENLEYKLIGGKAYFISQLKYLERKIIDDYNFLITNTENLEEEVNQYPNTVFLKEDLNKFKNLNFNLIEKIQKVISELKWEGDDSLVKEYRKLRLELSQNDTGLEIKNEGIGIIAITTRVQIGKNSGIKATTGFQAGNYTLEELETLFKEILKREDKSLEFIQFSLRSALDIYKQGGHVTPVYKDQIFRLQFDNKRQIIIPKGYENTIDFSNILLDSNPVPNKDFGKTLRFLSKFHKQSIYSKGTSVSSGNQYKNYVDLAVRNFIKGLLSDPQKYNLNTEINSYSELIEFVKGFDDKIKISKSSISRLKSRKMIFKTVPRTKETMKFIDYVKKKYTEFDEDSFFAWKGKGKGKGKEITPNLKVSNLKIYSFNFNFYLSICLSFIYTSMVFYGISRLNSLNILLDILPDILTIFTTF